LRQMTNVEIGKWHNEKMTNRYPIESFVLLCRENRTYNRSQKVQYASYLAKPNKAKAFSPCVPFGCKHGAILTFAPYSANPNGLKSFSYYAIFTFANCRSYPANGNKSTASAHYHIIELATYAINSAPAYRPSAHSVSFPAFSFRRRVAKMLPVPSPADIVR
jgi:hypothetical protein